MVNLHKKKKNKFKFSSHYIEEDLMYFMSVKDKVYFALNFLQSERYIEIIEILNEFLMQGILDSYSLEYNISDQDAPLIIIRFKEKNKNEIIMKYRQIHSKINAIPGITSNSIPPNLIKLYFLEILNMDKIKPKAEIKKFKDLIEIKEEDKSFFFRFYNIDFTLTKVNENAYFFSDLIKLLKSQKSTIRLIIPFKFIGSLFFYPYIVESFMIRSENHNLKNYVNDFFKIEALHFKKPEERDIGRVLWRLPLLEEYRGELNKENSSLEVFSLRDKPKLDEILKKIKSRLETRNVKYEVLNESALIIEKGIMIVLLDEFNEERIIKILEMQNIFKIYIIFLNQQHLRRLKTQYDNIEQLEQVKILSIKEFFQLNVDFF